MLESKFQSKLIKEIKDRFPGCEIMKNDPNYKQGFPDLTILYEDKWAVLETKRGEKAKRQPNQEYYVDKLNNMSFSRFICPENEKETINELNEFFNR